MLTLSMRSEEDIFTLILDTAAKDERVRAVLLNGSRADKEAVNDKFSDFDIVFIVKNLGSFTSDHDWVDIFGKRIIMQLPDDMLFSRNNDHSFHYLMLFEDMNRIDLTLYPIEKLNEFRHDSFTRILMDKDKIFQRAISDYNNYIMVRPSQKEFNDCCNEFWWISTYIAKALWRDEIIYAMYLIENPVRTMFSKMTEWYIGVHTDFSVSTGKNGRYSKNYLSADLYNDILATYTKADAENIKIALFNMLKLFSVFANIIANNLMLEYNTEEEKNVLKYLDTIFNDKNKKY